MKFYTNGENQVRVAKLVDAHDSGSCGEIYMGSSPFPDIYMSNKLIEFQSINDIIPMIEIYGQLKCKKILSILPHPLYLL